MAQQDAWRDAPFVRVDLHLVRLESLMEQQDAGSPAQPHPTQLPVPQPSQGLPWWVGVAVVTGVVVVAVACPECVGVAVAAAAVA